MTLFSFARFPTNITYISQNANYDSQTYHKLNSGRNAIVANTSDSTSNSTKLVTFIGKGGSGKTSAADLAAKVTIGKNCYVPMLLLKKKLIPLPFPALCYTSDCTDKLKHYAKEGLRTCLVLHSQDPSAELLMGCKIGSTPTMHSEHLFAVRLETSKMLLEPLKRLKKVDARLNLTQGVLEEVVGEELGILPGMDSIFSALALEKLVNFIPNLRSSTKHEYDIVVYDGISTEETLRLIGATEKAKWYIKYIRNMAEKTDIGRVVSPSFLKLAYESAKSNTGSTDGKTSQEIWNEIEQIIEKTSVSFQDPSKIGCYLVIDPSRRSSVLSALRYWGCAIQAGAQICGALGVPLQSSSTNEEEIIKMLSPLNYAYMPYFSADSSMNWNEILNILSVDAKQLLQCTNGVIHAPVRFDPSQKTVTLFMPGFDKSEIKLYQYRGRSELLVEAGDQRRIIRLPTAMQGKVGGAKFIDRNLVVKLR